MENVKYCKPINVGGYLIWRILPSGHIDCYLNWLILAIICKSLIHAICIGGYLIWRFLGSSQISQFKSPPNINRFTVLQYTTDFKVFGSVFCLKLQSTDFLSMTPALNSM